MTRTPNIKNELSQKEAKFDNRLYAETDYECVSLVDRIHKVD